MRRLVSALAVLVAAAGLVLAAGDKKFGKDLTLKEATKISAIYAAPDTFNDKRVLVEGTIVDVCKKRGCWIKIASDKEHQTLLFKVQDGIMVFPVEMKGKLARAEGVIQVTAKKAGEPGCAEGGDCCKADVVLKGEGAVVSEPTVTK